MASLIALRCTRCGKDTDTEHSRKTVCLECLVREAVAVDLAAYSRQWAKKRRYERFGRLRFNPEGITRLAKRINVRVHALVTGPKAIEFFNQLLHEARATAESGDRRIVVAQAGDLLGKRWPDGVRTLG